MSACLFMVGNIQSLSEEKLDELEKNCYRVLGGKYDKNNKFDCDYLAGMHHNVQMIFWERKRRIKKSIIEDYCLEHFNAIESYSKREGLGIEEVFYEYLKYERTKNRSSA